MCNKNNNNNNSKSNNNQTRKQVRRRDTRRQTPMAKRERYTESFCFDGFVYFISIVFSI